MNKQQVELAVGAGLELLGDKSETAIPAKLNDGIFFLKQLLMLIAQGQLGLTPTVQEPSPTPPKKVGEAIQKTSGKKRKRTAKSPPKPLPKPRKRRK